MGTAFIANSAITDPPPSFSSVKFASFSVLGRVPFRPNLSIVISLV